MQLTKNILSFDIAKEKISLEPLELSNVHTSLIQRICDRIVNFYRTIKGRAPKNLRVIISKTEHRVENREILCTFAFSDSSKQSSLLNVYCHESSTIIAALMDNPRTDKTEESVCDIDSAAFDLCVQYFFETQ